jgi:hypothetical protein
MYVTDMRAAALLAPLTTAVSPAVLACYADAGLTAVLDDLAALAPDAEPVTRTTLEVAADALAAIRDFLSQPAPAGDRAVQRT